MCKVITGKKGKSKEVVRFGPHILYKQRMINCGEVIRQRKGVWASKGIKVRESDKQKLGKRVA